MLDSDLFPLDQQIAAEVRVLCEMCEEGQESLN